MNHQDDQNKESRKYLIPVDGKYYETTKEIYEVYYQMDRRERYLEERDIKKGVINFSDMGLSFDTTEGSISDMETDVEKEVIDKVLMETVLEAILILSKDEKWLIQELFFYGKSQRQLSKEMDIPLMTISNRKKRILEKIRKYIGV